MTASTSRARPGRRDVVSRLAITVAVVALLVPAGRAAAHDVPDEMVFAAHVAPEGTVLEVPLRVPLVWLADYDVPLRGPGYIDLVDTDELDAALAPAAGDLADDLALFEDGRRLEPEIAGWRLSLPSDRSFDDHRDAIDNIAGQRLDDDTNLFWNQGFLDIHLRYPIEDQQASFALLVDDPALAERLHVLTTFVGPDGDTRTYDLLAKWGQVDLNPGIGGLARMFAGAGLTALLTGWEHVLFVGALALALARRPASPARPVVAFGAVLALMVLATGATAGVERPFAVTLVSTGAAASLLVIAIGNVLARSLRLRWLTAAACAIPHGLLLAGGLEEILQFRDGVLPLVAYAVGAVAGVAVVFGAAMGAGWLLARHAGARKHGPAVAALLVGYVGWRDTLQRGEVLLSLDPPRIDAATLIGLGRGAAVILLVVAALWLGFELVADRRRATRAGDDGSGPDARVTPEGLSMESSPGHQAAPGEPAVDASGRGDASGHDRAAINGRPHAASPNGRRS